MGMFRQSTNQNHYRFSGSNDVAERRKRSNRMRLGGINSEAGIMQYTPSVSIFALRFFSGWKA